MSVLSDFTEKQPELELKHWKYCYFSKPFWQLFGILVLANYFGTFFSYSFKAYGSDSVSHKQINESLLTWAASIGSGFVNGVTRFSMGALVDKVTFRSIFTVVMLIQLVVALGCFYAVNVPWLFFICIMLNYMSIGATFTLLPVATTNVYGLKVGP